MARLTCKVWVSWSSKILFCGRSSNDSLPDSLRSVSKRNCITPPVSIMPPESTVPSLDMVYCVAGPHSNRHRSDVTFMLMCLVSGPQSPLRHLREISRYLFCTFKSCGQYFYRFAAQIHILENFQKTSPRAVCYSFHTDWLMEDELRCDTYIAHIKFRWWGWLLPKLVSCV